MSGSLRAELRKITTTRLWWVVLIGILLLSGIYAMGVALLQPGAGGAAFSDPGIVRSVYNGGNPVARWLALVLGVATMGAEYRHQTPSMLSTPSPPRRRPIWPLRGGPRC